MKLLRWIKRLVLLVVVLALVLLFGGPAFLSSDFGRTRVESALKTALRRDVAIGDLDVGFLFASITAADVRMGHPEGFPEGDTVAVRSMAIECGLRDLLDKRVKGTVRGSGVEIVVLQKGDRTTLDGLGGEGGKDSEPGETPPLDLQVDFEDCRFEYRNLDSGETTRFDGIAVHARLSDQPAERRGNIAVTLTEIRHDPVVVRDVELDLHADGAAIVLDGARGRMAGGGALEAEGRFELDEASTWSARIDAKEVSLDGTLVPVVAALWPFAATAGGNLEGKLTARFDLRGQGVTWESVRPGLAGTGELRLDDLSLPPESVLGQVARFVDESRTGAVALNDAGAEFRIANGWLDFNRLSASGKEARYDLAGRVSLEGKLDLRVDLMPLVKLASSDTHDKLAKYLDKLDAKLGGTTTAPKLGLPDTKELLRQAAQNALEKEGKKAIEDKLKDALDKIR